MTTTASGQVPVYSPVYSGGNPAPTPTPIVGASGTVVTNDDPKSSTPATAHTKKA